MSELLRPHEGDDEVDDGGDRERGGDDRQDRHSFSTPLATRPTSANSAIVAAM
jgi:hypothetical protein